MRPQSGATIPPPANLRHPSPAPQLNCALCGSRAFTFVPAVSPVVGIVAGT